MWVTGIPFCRFLLVSEHRGPPATRCCLPDPARNTPGGEASSSMELPKPWGLLPRLASLTLKIYQVNKNTVESQCLAWGLKINDIYYWNDLGAFQLIDGLTDCGVDAQGSSTWPSSLSAANSTPRLLAASLVLASPFTPSGT